MPLRSSGEEYLKGTVIRVSIRRTAGGCPGFTGTSRHRRATPPIDIRMARASSGRHPTIGPTVVGHERAMSLRLSWQILTCGRCRAETPSATKDAGQASARPLAQRPRPIPWMWATRPRALPLPDERTTVHVQCTDNPSGRPPAPLHVEKSCPSDPQRVHHRPSAAMLLPQTFWERSRAVQLAFVWANLP